MSTAYIRDPMERVVADALTAAGIRYHHETDQGDTRDLDFHLPDHGLWIEVCRFYTPRKIEQMTRAPNVILIQGMEAAKAFARFLNPLTEG